MLAVENPTIRQIAETYPRTIAELKKLDPIRTAASFAGLLLLPQLQANCLRIEALIHIAMAYCDGEEAPTREFVRRSFKRLDQGYCGRMEDPSEDVFVSLVNTPRGNFRVFEGIREGNAFHLQRILNLVETMPDSPAYNRIRKSIESLLRLSDSLADRAGVSENELGQELPLKCLSAAMADQASGTCDLIRFNIGALTQAETPIESLSEFILNLQDGPKVRDQFMGNTEVERRPLVLHNDCVHLLLPTAVGSAITRFVIESVLSMGQAAAFEHALAGEYTQLFRRAPILGTVSRPEIRLQKITGGRIGSMMSEVDPGRFLHLLFFVDGLDDFSSDGLVGFNAAPEVLSETITKHLAGVSDQARKQAGFRDGISLMISCGFGRGLYLDLENNLPDHWRLESMPAHDLATLGWLSGFSPLSLWRLLDSQEAIRNQGTELLNANGLLNLVAWSRQLGGHLVPHGALPKEFATQGAGNLLVVRQNAIRELRHGVTADWDPRRIQDSQGKWVQVRKISDSEFQEDKNAPLYASEEDVLRGRLRGVYLAPNRPWWIEIIAPENAPRDPVFQYWMMLCTWLRRAAPILDEAYPCLPAGPVSFRISFATIVGGTSGRVTPKDANQLRSLVQVNAEFGLPSVRVDVADGFDDGLAQPENLAERAIAEALIEGTAKISGELADNEKRARLMDTICPNSEARFIHRFEARFFRDFLGSELSGDPILIDELDAAAARIGLGWRARSRESNSEISGVPECTSYLNDAVHAVLDDLCAQLRCLDRHLFVGALLQNNEAISHSRDVWRRTAQANIAIHDDKDAAVRTIIEHHSRLNASSLATRILLEAAICECPLEGGRRVGQLDLSRAMAKAMQTHFLGGWSDAIHWGAIKPLIRITPLGDVHVHHAFIDTVYNAFGRVGGEVQVSHDTQSYAGLYIPAEANASVEGVFESQFYKKGCQDK